MPTGTSKVPQVRSQSPAGGVGTVAGQVARLGGAGAVYGVVSRQAAEAHRLMDTRTTTGKLLPRVAGE
ncbi:hypothetical protein [Streptomyces sp. RKAG293]|uniref:hypothetical protein n=1 Tax=Streptomyces sp. RKAG293 TaxID=2893403 RepID=UPI00203369F5|nr:hypothetical protein [Streptomyces sp. RKAG293]MCM2420829.1 hypothetical protein [Streptomyces sp. RKAG293]